MKKNNWPSALILSLVLSLTGCGKPSAEVQLQKARDYMAKGEKKAAIIEFKNLLSDYPDNADARRQLGQLYLETGETDAALIELKKAVEYGADEVNTASSLAKALLAKGEHAKVLDYLDPKKIPAVATTPALIVLRGNALAARGMPDEAAKAYAEALKLDPKFADASIGLAKLELGQRKADAAISVLDGVLASSPASTDALIMKADILRAKGDRSAAKDLYLRALGSDKAKVQAYLGLIGLELESDQIAEARKYLQAAQKLSADNIYVRHLEAMILLREKQADKALTAILEVLKVAPGFPAANMLAANIEFSKGLYQQSAAHVNAVLTASPNSLSARRLQAAIFYKQNDLEKASAALLELMEQAPDDVGVFALAGEVFAKKKDFARSMAAYARASQLKPQNSELRTKLAMSRMATGDADKAISDLESIAAGDANAFQADIILALAHINKKEWKPAELVVSRLAKKQPDSPLPGSLRASILLGKNDAAGARKELELVLQRQPGFVPAAVNLARLDLMENKPQQAQQRFNALLAKENQNIDLMMAYAEFLLAINKLADAQPWLEKAHQAQPESIQPVLALTSLALRNQDNKRALGLAQEALAKKPDNPQLLENLASVQIASGDQNLALATLAKLAKARPNSPIAYFKIASVKVAAGDRKGAIENLQKAIAVSPAFGDAYLQLTGLYLKEERVAEAANVALALQKQYPKSADGYVLQGDVFMHGKQFSEAANAYNKALSLGAAALPNIKLHQALVAQGKEKDAEIAMAKWLKTAPTDIEARIYMADLSMKRKDLKAAAAQYESVLQLQPNQVLAMNNLAYVYQQTKDSRGLALAEKLIVLQPDLPAIQDTVAMILLDAGQTQRALELLKKATTHSPEQGDIRMHLVQAYVRAGQKEKAKAEMQAITPKMQKSLDPLEFDKLTQQLK